ncbi:MAG: OmpP1/FadL family transporter [Myxococcota bacterium]
MLAGLLGCALLASAASAGGLYVNEFATTVQGNARAGATAWAPDASIALFNPAGMVELDDHSFASGFALGVADIEFDASSTPTGGGNGGNQGGLAPLTSANYVHKVSDRFRFGMTIFSLSGSILDPSNNWAGRFEVTELSLFTLSFAPSLGIKVTDWLSIGGGPVITYGVLDWKLRVQLPNREGKIRLDELDDWEVTGRIGATLHPTDDLNIAVVYLGETQFDLGGDVDLSAGASAVVGLDVKLPLPQAVEVGVHWQVTEELALLGTFDWEDWSAFDNLPVSTARLGARVPTGWRDTYKVGLGAAYGVTENLLLQTGVTYDTSPVHNKDRVTALPVDRQIRAAVGGVYSFENGIDFGLNFVYVSLGKAKVRTNNVRGEYDDNNLFVFGFTLGANDLPWAGRATL